MRALILRPAHASPSKPGDAGEFAREALRFGASIGGGSARDVRFNNRAGKGARRREVEQAIASGGPWDVIALFGHGLKTSIQTGHGVENVPQLADVIAANAAPRLLVELYACDAARDDDASKIDDVTDSVGGDGGFADSLRDALATRGLTGHVDAHAKPGHATKNPHVRRFHMDAGPAAGAEWLVEPGSPLWRLWITALKAPAVGRGPEPLRLRFPFLTTGAIHAELAA